MEKEGHAIKTISIMDKIKNSKEDINMSEKEKKDSKVKKFLKDHKETVIVIAGGIAGGVAGYVGVSIYQKGWKKGLIVGATVGSNLMVQQLDHWFPETDIKNLYDAYEKAHPEEFVDVKL